MGEIIREAGQEHQGAIVRHNVERVEVRRGEVIAIEPRPEVRPFYAGLAMAAPDGRGVLTASTEEKLAAYL